MSTYGNSSAVNMACMTVSCSCGRLPQETEEPPEWWSIGGQAQSAIRAPEAWLTVLDHLEMGTVLTSEGGAAGSMPDAA
eukprot:5402767-Amphidinium_carterae.1